MFTVYTCPVYSGYGPWTLNYERIRRLTGSKKRVGRYIFQKKKTSTYPHVNVSFIIFKLQHEKMSKDDRTPYIRYNTKFNDAGTEYREQ